MRILQLLTIVAVLGASVHFGLAQDASSFKSLYSFKGKPDGARAQAGVVISKNGGLYGTTEFGGTSNAGTVFKLTPPASPGGAWTETVIHDFTGGSGDGAEPGAGVVISNGGLLYGTTSVGGASNAGTVFSLTPPASHGGAWAETVLYNFTGGSDGGRPFAGVVIGSGGVLYGATYYGGNANFGTVFSLTPPTSPGGAWTESVLFGFPSRFQFGGAYPSGSVVIGSGGVLYGTTTYGFLGSCGVVPAIGCGVLFSVTPPTSPGGAWTDTVLHEFTGGSSDGAEPGAGVVIGIDGVLYGTTPFGGSGPCNVSGFPTGCGTVFSLTPPATPGATWTETVIHDFTGGSGDGANPSALGVRPRNRAHSGVKPPVSSGSALS